MNAGSEVDLVVTDEDIEAEVMHILKYELKFLNKDALLENSLPGNPARENQDEGSKTMPVAASHTGGRNLDRLKPVKKKSSYSCPQCSFRTVASRRLKIHLRGHSSFTRQTNQMVNERSQGELKEQDNKFTPKLESQNISEELFNSNQTPESQKNYQKPVFNSQIHSGLKNSIATGSGGAQLGNISSSSDTPVPLPTTVGSQPYLCEFCPYHTLNKRQMRKHLKTHRENETFACPECTFSTEIHERLVSHMKVHSEEKPYTCHVCNFKTKLKPGLKKHMRIHTGEKPFSCEFCPYKTAQQSNMTVHLRTHTGDKPFSCPALGCPYRTSSRSGLKIHIKNHGEKKPYKCKSCSYTTSLLSNLTVHMRMHSLVT